MNVHANILLIISKPKDLFYSYKYSMNQQLVIVIGPDNHIHVCLDRQVMMYVIDNRCNSSRGVCLRSF